LLAINLLEITMISGPDDTAQFSEAFGAATADEQPKAQESLAADEAMVNERIAAESPQPKALNFKQAFAAARKAGDKVFEFGGKKFTTALKGEAAKPAASKPQASQAPQQSSKPGIVDELKAANPAPAAKPKPSNSVGEYAAAADEGLARDAADKIKLPPAAAKTKMFADKTLPSNVRDTNGDLMNQPESVADISKVGRVNVQSSPSAGRR
jgi:hypothetical protein